MVSPLGSILQGVRPPENTGFANSLQGLIGGSERIQSMRQDREIQAQGAQNQADQQGRAKAMQSIQFVNSLAKTLKSQDPSQWAQTLGPNIPQLQQLGYDTEQLPQLTPEVLDGIIAQTDAALGGQGGQQQTAGQRERSDLMADLSGAIGQDGKLKPVSEMTAKQQAAAVDLRLIPPAAVTGDERIAKDKALTEQVAESKATIAGRKKFAEMTGASRSNAIDKGFEKIQKIDANLLNYDRAISAMDSGAGTGVIESKFFPSIKAATVNLNQIQNELTLDVLNAATFGALSESELSMARETALPKGLNEAELKQWLLDKKTAQEKLRAYFQEQINFIDDGGTVAGFLRSKEKGRSQAPSAQGANSSNGEIKFLGFE